MVDISDAAATEIKRLQSSRHSESAELASLPLRLSIKLGGCSGLYYDLGLDRGTASGASNDHKVNVQDITLVVDFDSWQYVEALKIDYSEDLMGGGFRFYNSQAKTVCGCGMSFSLKNKEDITVS